jgi:hypothetical protein
VEDAREEPPLTQDELRWLRSEKRFVELDSRRWTAVFCLLVALAILLAILVGIDRPTVR